MTRQEILRMCAERFDVPLAMMGQKGRRDAVKLARQAAMYEMRAAGKWSSAQIGAFLNVDGSTVIQGADAHADRMGIPRAEKGRAPQTQRRRVTGKVFIAKAEGTMDGLRYGRIWIGPSQLAFRFDRLTGEVRLFKNDVRGETVYVEVTDPERLEAARQACVEKLGVVGL